VDEAAASSGEIAEERRAVREEVELQAEKGCRRETSQQKNPKEDEEGESHRLAGGGRQNSDAADGGSTGATNRQREKAGGGGGGGSRQRTASITQTKAKVSLLAGKNANSTPAEGEKEPRGSVEAEAQKTARKGSAGMTPGRAEKRPVEASNTDVSARVEDLQGALTSEPDLVPPGAREGGGLVAVPAGERTAVDKLDPGADVEFGNSGVWEHMEGDGERGIAVGGGGGVSFRGVGESHKNQTF